MTVVRRRAVVSGRVQGVGFRWACAEEAQRLGVSGRARNLGDGTAEVDAEGDEAAVQALVRWLQHGPAFARVESVAVEDAGVEGLQGFRAG